MAPENMGQGEITGFPPLMTPVRRTLPCVRTEPIRIHIHIGNLLLPQCGFQLAGLLQGNGKDPGLGCRLL